MSLGSWYFLGLFAFWILGRLYVFVFPMAIVLL